MPNIGDTVKIESKKSTEVGILMPSSDKKVIIIKLDNGYNMGFEKKDVKKMSIVSKKKAIKEAINKKVSKNKKLPTIAVLHTGGTIASKIDYASGGVSAKFSANDLINMIPELKDVANIETELVANMMSEDMTFKDYQKLAKAVSKYVKKGVDGIIIGHGTDTLSYTAAALSFMLEGVNIPTLLVGSQRSSDRGSSDAAINLLCAAKFIASSDFTGVAVCMHSSASDDSCAIIVGTKARKMHTSRRDAFKAINDTPIALIESSTGKIKYLKEKYPRKTKSNKLRVLDKMSGKIALLKTYPNQDSLVFEFFTKNYDAIVIEGTGLGHAPTNLGTENLKNYKILKKFIKKGGIVAITSQCLYGRVHPNVYTNLRRLSEIGCIFCSDMLPETAYIKLSWLLGNFSKEKAKEMLTQNLHGEINERLLFEKDFV